MSDINKEKRAEIIQDALDYLDDDMIEKVDLLRMQSQKVEESGRNRKKRVFYNHRILAMAASVCLLIIGAFAWENLIGPSDYQDGILHGTESADKLKEPENAPGLDEDMEKGTECDTIPDANIPVETEGDTECIATKPDDTSAHDSAPGEENPEEPLPPEEIDPVEPDYYSPMGDVYQLTDNYVKVTMIPDKVWASEETIKDNFAKSKEIEEKYYEIIDKFVETLCDTPRLRTDMVMDTDKPVDDTDVYHIFFQRTDGEIVQVCIFADYGFVYFYDNSGYCMKIDEDILYEVLKVLWKHW